MYIIQILETPKLDFDLYFFTKNLGTVSEGEKYHNVSLIEKRYDEKSSSGMLVDYYWTIKRHLPNQRENHNNLLYSIYFLYLLWKYLFLQHKETGCVNFFFIKNLLLGPIVYLKFVKSEKKSKLCEKLHETSRTTINLSIGYKEHCACHSEGIL